MLAKSIFKLFFDMPKLWRMIRYSLLRHTVVYVCVIISYFFPEMYQDLHISYTVHMLRLTSH